MFKNTNVLELGSGTGLLSIILASLGKNLVLIKDFR
jgi:ribosomal protein L11 methylase PrmA